MEAHEALRRHEHVAGAHDHHNLELEPDGTRRLAQQAAVVVAIIAGFLAVATFLSNEAVKEVITEETQAAETSARLEANNTKTTIADSNAVLLRVIGADSTAQKQAVAKAEALEARITEELAPIDRELAAEIRANRAEGATAEDQHLFFELSQVGLQIGIVLAGIAILARRRWLLGGGIVVATVGVALLGLGAIA